jgi:hypothetical protein
MTPQRELLLETAVLAFLADHEGSWVLRRSGDGQLVVTGGMTTDRVATHRRMLLRTAGLWLPVFLVVTLLRRPKTVYISLSVFDEPVIRELS